jgi:hypothetical protein
MNKSLTSLLGFALIVLGVIALAWGGISWTRQKKVLDLGPLQATTEEKKTIPLSPLLGVVALAGGVALVVLSRRGA